MRRQLRGDGPDATLGNNGLSTMSSTSGLETTRGSTVEGTRGGSTRVRLGAFRGRERGSFGISPRNKRPRLGVGGALLPPATIFARTPTLTVGSRSVAPVLVQIRTPSAPFGAIPDDPCSSRSTSYGLVKQRSGTTHAQNSGDASRGSPDSVPNLRTSPHFGRNPAGLPRNGVDSGQFGPISPDLRPRCLGPKFHRVLVEFGQNYGPHSTDIRRNLLKLANVGPHAAQFGPNGGEFYRL